MAHRWGSRLTVSLDVVTEDKHKIAALPLPGQIEALQVLPYKGVLSNENMTREVVWIAVPDQ